MKKRALFIGGTGTISTAIVKRLMESGAWEVWVLNRGSRNDALPEGVHAITADINDEEDVRKKIDGMVFDSVCEFIGFEEGETTSLREVRGLKAEVRGEFYNLNGQRVAQPTKGLYIVNGRKVVVK